MNPTAEPGATTGGGAHREPTAELLGPVLAIGADTLARSFASRSTKIDGMRRRLPIFVVLLLVADGATAIDRVTFATEAGEQTVEGRVLAADATGGRLVESSDGALTVVTGEEVRGVESDDAPFAPLGADAFAEAMLAELPEGFQVYQTAHYVVCYNTSREYAQWTSSLLERLHKAFTAYWQRAGFELHEPEFPLAVIVYSNADQYAQESRDELGSATGAVVGHYSLATNRVRMYDLTGADQFRRNTGARVSRRDISRLLASPAAEPLVATIIHEATHQIAFNCGLQQRYADIPLWLLEGMAVYFETPDLSAGRGWRGIGKVNQRRLAIFRQNLRTWSPARIAAIVASDKPLRETRTANDAYSDAWALNYYLIQRQPKQYVEYVRMMSERKPLRSAPEDQRISDFTDHFGDLAPLSRELAELMQRL
ncbi:hypothetical protein Pla175_46610 [Pirellulimonas nuda]|uniref:DUF1570 domain-containing protein n=1 Tax=Pirellulimonas nuda TaxID=2528009 RepID=A0A518DID3_9BACT|nr:DUF1570 domain-containing protein [Pirellulimonas nuda]QDU91241.1 hypothetical protein Pla175_46610 [Pirellulimonas nuda]